MLIDLRTLEDLSQKLGAMLPPSLGKAREDLTRNFRSRRGRKKCQPG